MRKASNTAIEEFELVGEGSLDDRKRVSLAKAIAVLRDRLGPDADTELRFRMYINRAGQVLLDPAVTVPIREAWLFRNPAALAKVRKGLAEAAAGHRRAGESFAKYADDEIE
jgi:hypothetical protein